MKSYGITKSVNLQTKEELHLEEFYNLGYTIIEAALTSEELIELRSELDRVYMLQEEALGLDNLVKIKEKNMARIPLAYSELYVKLASRKSMLNYVEKILDNFFVLHLQNGIINKPNEEHHQSSWHRNLPYQNWTSSEPLACNVFYCLDDFNSETGGTFVLPFSHQLTEAPSNQYFSKHAVQVNAKAGSVILFNSMIFHKAGYNQSKNIIRRGVNHLYVKPFIAQQIDLPSFLDGKYSDDDLLSMLFGYRTRLSKSVDEYRTKRLKNLL